MKVKLSKGLKQALARLDEGELGFVYTPANEDGQPELAVGPDGPPNDVVLRLMSADEVPAFVTGSVHREDGRLIFTASGGELDALAEHLAGAFAAKVPELAEAEVRSGEGSEVIDEEEPLDEEYGDEDFEDDEEPLEPEESDQPEAEEEPEEQGEEPEAEVISYQKNEIREKSVTPEAPPAPAPRRAPAPAPPRSIALRLVDAFQSEPALSAAYTAVLEAERAWEQARLPHLAALTALDAARQRFRLSVDFVRANTSVNAMKDSIRTFEALAASERAAATAKGAVRASQATLVSSSEALRALAEARADRDPGFAALLEEAQQLLPWGRLSATGTLDLPALDVAVERIAGLAPGIREVAKRFRNVAQTRPWMELSPGSLVAEVPIVLVAAELNRGHARARVALDAVVAGLPAMADALGAAKHARTWADKLPADKRAVAEQSQGLVAAEAAAWLELAAGLAVLA